MDTLRISLIVIGVIVVLFIYFWMRRANSRRGQIRERIEPVLEQRPDFGRKVIEDESVMFAESSLGSAPEPEPASVQPAPKAEPQMNIVALHVLAREGRQFRGLAVVQAANRAGLRFGDMSIFHHEATDMLPHQFSMANMVEPGTFDLDALEGFATPGVLFFMDMSRQRQPLAAAEFMLETALRIGNDLDGVVADGRRNRLDDTARRTWLEQAGR